jgi:hypothetical protein
MCKGPVGEGAKRTRTVPEFISIPVLAAKIKKMASGDVSSDATYFAGKRLIYFNKACIVLAVFSLCTDQVRTCHKIGNADLQIPLIGLQRFNY